MNVKYSYGIALCRFNGTKREILLIKKRKSYYFYNFVLGHYNRNNEKRIMKVLNNITFNEKMDILTFNFDIMWSRLWNNPKPEASHIISYRKNKERFENMFLGDNGKRLRRLINNSLNYETPWEIPKGKGQGDEKNLDVAIREFGEETDIDYSKYDILFHIPQIINSYIDDGVIYRTAYYVAIPNGNIVPRINFQNEEQIAEVEAIRWINVDEIKYLMFSETEKKRLQKLVGRIFKDIKKYYHAF